MFKITATSIRREEPNDNIKRKSGKEIVSMGCVTNGIV
jgi:hypothetical protein